MHKKCTRICGKLVHNVNLRCVRCCNVPRSTDGHPCNSIVLGALTEFVDLFCYLGDTINAGGCQIHGVIARARYAWGNFRELLPLLTKRYTHIKTRENIFNICVRSVLLCGSEC